MLLREHCLYFQAGVLLSEHCLYFQAGVLLSEYFYDTERLEPEIQDKLQAVLKDWQGVFLDGTGDICLFSGTSFPFLPPQDSVNGDFPDEFHLFPQQKQRKEPEKKEMPLIKFCSFRVVVVVTEDPSTLH